MLAGAVILDVTLLNPCAVGERRKWNGWINEGRKRETERRKEKGGGRE